MISLNTFTNWWEAEKPFKTSAHALTSSHGILNPSFEQQSLCRSCRQNLRTKSVIVLFQPLISSDRRRSTSQECLKDYVASRGEWASPSIAEDCATARAVDEVWHRALAATAAPITPEAGRVNAALKLAVVGTPFAGTRSGAFLSFIDCHGLETASDDSTQRTGIPSFGSGAERRSCSHSSFLI